MVLVSLSVPFFLLNTFPCNPCKCYNLKNKLILFVYYNI